MSKTINSSSQKSIIDFPDLLDLQFNSFDKLLQLDSQATNRKSEGLYNIFQEHFPISDIKEHFNLEFIGYSIEDPIYTPEECLNKDLTYNVALKVKLKLTCKEEDSSRVINQEIFFGFIPYMTPQGSFIINGKERVIVSQIHRSYGVFFSQTTHLSGIKIFFAKIIPLKGAWIEFVADINKTIYVYIDRNKKFPITLILRALGYSTDKEICSLFNIGEEIKVTKKNLEANKGKKIAVRIVKTYVEEFVDPETGEIISISRSNILVERDTILDQDSIQTILDSEEKTIIIRGDQQKSGRYNLIYNTLKKDDANSEKEAIEHIYRKLKSAEPPDEETAREFVGQILFSTKRTYLGEVGRYTMNKKLGLSIEEETHTLTKEDIIKTIFYLLDFIDGKVNSDDIDHLGNRRVRPVGEQLYDVVNTGIARMARIIRERMSVRASEEFNPVDLISTRILSSPLSSFFGTNPLSQFMDQVNILSEVSHKRRLSSLGKGGISRERAGFEVRDVHYTHYGRICPIETPDNLSIGLISSLAIHARLDEMGFIKTPYKKIINGKIDPSGNIYHITADKEEGKLIAQYTSQIDQKGNFLQKKLKVRQQGNFLLEVPEKIDLIDVAREQMTSVAAGLIPFLEHNDASRALMGANMQRQAIPLQEPQAPIVGTGLEKRIVKDSKTIQIAEADGIVSYVDASKITIKYKPLKNLEAITKTYHLKKLISTNQNTCINLKPTVKKGDHVKKGQFLCEGYGTQAGELALGRNLTVAFMSCKGYNYEDAIVISQEIAEKFTSLHIYELILEAVDTKLGPEKFTADIPNMSETQLQNLDENGIITVGKQVKPGDVLVGKVTPKAQTDLSPENVLLQAIFGEKAYNVKDTSLKASPYFEGVVIDTQLFKRKERKKTSREQATKTVSLLKKIANKQLEHLKQKTIKTLVQILQNQKTNPIYDKEGNTLFSSKQTITEQTLQQKIFTAKEENLDLDAISIKHINFSNWTNQIEESQAIQQTLQNYQENYQLIISNYKKEKFTTEIGDDLPLGTLQKAKIRIAKKRKMQVGDKMAGRFGNKGVLAKVMRKEDMPYFEDGTPVDILLSPLGLPSRMNLGQLYEAMLGLAGKKLDKKYRIKVFDSPSIEDIEKELQEAQLPKFGLTTLYDGCTGEPFDQKVTCGVIYMLKLNHLVDEKMHARSTGPYGLITQQPLGGRAQFGGQRLGEMEAVALQAHGAAHTLRESLSVKSDDVTGRKKTLEAIVKGKNLPEPGLSEVFKILKQELRGLNVDLTLVTENNPSNILKK